MNFNFEKLRFDCICIFPYFLFFIFRWTLTITLASSSQWTLLERVMVVDRSCPTTWNSCSDRWPCLSQTMNRLQKSSSSQKDSNMPRAWAENLWLSSICQSRLQRLNSLDTYSLSLLIISWYGILRYMYILVLHAKMRNAFENKHLAYRWFDELHILKTGMLLMQRTTVYWIVSIWFSVCHFHWMQLIGLF